MTGHGTWSTPSGWVTYSNGDILGGGEEPIDQDTHKGRIKTEFGSELGEGGVSHGLWDDDGADGDTSGQGQHVPCWEMFRFLFLFRLKF